MVMNVADAMSAYRQAMSGAAKGATGAAQTDGAGFADTLKGFLKDTVSDLHDAEKMALDGAQGKANVQDIVMAMSKAEVDFTALNSVRDKLISAYQEIMRTTA